MLQVILYALFFTFSVEKTTCDLTFTLTNINGNKGDIVFGVYNIPENFPKVGKEYRVVRFPANTAGSTFKINDLKPGEYAVGIFHDLNTDGVCNLNFIGVPKEGYGFSNNIKPVLSAPTFEECKFKLTADKHLSVKLIY